MNIGELRACSFDKGLHKSSCYKLQIWKRPTN